MKWQSALAGISWRKVAVMAPVLLLAMVGYVLTDVVLRQNSIRVTADSDASKGDFASLVAWLPDKAKKAVEFRAKSIYLENVMKRTRDVDAHARARFVFADYIRTEDPKGSDSVLASVIKDEKFARSRWAYDSWAALLLADKSVRPVTLPELHAYLATLKWPEDCYQGWMAVHRRANVLAAKRPALYLEIMAPLLAQLPSWRNYATIWSTAANQAKKKGDAALAAKYNEQRLAINKLPPLSDALLKKDFRYRQEYVSLRESLTAATTPEEKVRALTGLALHTRGVENQESDALLCQAVETPELRACRYAYLPMAYLLLYKNTRHPVTLAEYQAEVAKLGDDLQLEFDAFSLGLYQLKERKAKPQDILALLNPLVNRQVKYEEYAEFFRAISKAAEQTKNQALHDEAEKFLFNVQNTVLPTLFDRPDGMEGGD
ncbi:MAG: hypothetical protein IJJ33_19470 [Victivallales bacterium]|nr:hypothetical protein [Victivallales bacterium]